ncbi:aminoglycoside phosphotransferase family protein [Streptomyces sp. NBC_01218]|uniref:aminoglycoside phosphotransferase family protein n=1 Tax=Streptomyces sp. NBC_01218 TaxID=2903780 RepID=UPI002E15E05D
MLTIPDAFARATVGREGAAGAAWIGALPSLVEELLDRWSCSPDGTITHGGVGVVLPVRGCAEGAAMVKVSFPHPGNVHEPDGLVAWGDRGAVLLHRRDDARFAMLLERVGTSNLAESGDDDTVAVVAGEISRRLAVPAPAGPPRLRERADDGEEELRSDTERLPHTLPGRVTGHARATVRELGPEQPDTVVHGGLHGRNILRAEREPWPAVGPKGYPGDPAYDGGPSSRHEPARSWSRTTRAGPWSASWTSTRRRRDSIVSVSGGGAVARGHRHLPRNPARSPRRPERAGPRARHRVRGAPGRAAHTGRVSGGTRPGRGCGPVVAPERGRPR